MLKARLLRLWRRVTESPISTDLAPYRRRVAEVATHEPRLRALSDPQLQEAARRCLDELRARGPGSAQVALLLAMVREAGRRLLRVRLFDEQVIASLALAEGQVVEVQTGEGKTLAAVAPALLEAAARRGVHLWTFNDYLASRDAEWMGPLYRLFGLSVAAITHGLGPAERRAAYAADVTYATATETGFDFLRDQLVLSPDAQVQRPLHAVIVDEADSLLVDEARIPLVLAGGDEAVDLDFERLLPVVTELSPEVDFEREEHGRNVFLTEVGAAKLEARLGCGSLYAPENLALLTTVNLCLYAVFLLRRDVDYIVRQGRIELVDDRTGRVVKQRRWPHGLQPALEIKEGVPREVEGRVLGTMTVQHLCRLYPHRGGMTGTAQACAAELRACYGMNTLVIPPHRPCVRVDEPDLVFPTREAKARALLAEVERAHLGGQPILIGTASVEESEQLAARLRAGGLRVELLNARNDSSEAALIAGAGLPGAITISTNMAGRGTDIRLGGPDGRLAEAAAASGGLYVLGTNRHESRRIDDQLRGRAGRQGEAGRSRFFISLEDPLFKKYGLSSRLPSTRRSLAPDDLVRDAATRREIERTQRIVEGQGLEQRMDLLKYSGLVEQQRQRFQAMRGPLLSPGAACAWLEGRDRTLLAQLRTAATKDLEEGLRRVLLSHLDDGWAEHLAQVAQIQEGIYLHSAGVAGALTFKVEPIAAFRSAVGQAFAELVDTVDSRALQAVRLAAEQGDFALEHAGVERPSATWTYLVNDEPFANPAEKLGRMLRQLLRAERGGPTAAASPP
jgi:preprotein translocase subunit SecA